MDKTENAQQNSQETLEENLQRTLVILKEIKGLKDEYDGINNVSVKDERFWGGITIRVIGLISPVFSLAAVWKLSEGDIFRKVAVLTVAFPLALIVAGLVNEGGKALCGYYGKRTRNRRVALRKGTLEQIQRDYNKNMTILETYSMVPELYRNIEAVETFIHYFDSKRADSLKEAINLFEWEWRHKEKINELKEFQKSQYIIFGEANDNSRAEIPNEEADAGVSNLSKLNAQNADLEVEKAEASSK